MRACFAPQAARAGEAASGRRCKPSPLRRPRHGPVPGRGEPGAVRAVPDTDRVIREEARRLSTWEERHRRLVARISIALALTLVVDLVGAALTDLFEKGVRGGDIHGFGDALFFSTVQ